MINVSHCLFTNATYNDLDLASWHGINNNKETKVSGFLSGDVLVYMNTGTNHSHDNYDH